VDRRVFLKSGLVTASASGLTLAACDTVATTQPGTCSASYQHTDVRLHLRYPLASQEQRDGLAESDLDLRFPPRDIRRYYPNS
jgi:hypothetical protein